MGTLVRACEACRDAALAFGIPFVSGKDSLHNQFTNSETGEVIRIPPTLLISAMGIINDVSKCITMDFKSSGNNVYLMQAENPRELQSLCLNHRTVSGLIASGRVAAAHDVSDGGLAVAIAEMCIASGLGFRSYIELGFDERPGQYLVEIADNQVIPTSKSCTLIGTVAPASILTVSGSSIPIAELTNAWRGTLDW